MRPREARIYADHAATTSVRPEVAARMLDVMTNAEANPSSLHHEGRRARAVLDESRETVARVLGAEPREIVFTGGGSEADTLAIRGALLARMPARDLDRACVLVSPVEHHAVLHAVEALAAQGARVTPLSIDHAGRVEPVPFGRALDRAVAERPAGGVVLASVMLANNEVGTISPIAELAALARAREVVFHCDAVQAPGRLPLGVRALGVDLLALSGHKCGGPHGVGALYVRDGIALAAQVHGGGQEGGRRAGTENVAGIAGFALALDLAERERLVETSRLTGLRDLFEAELRRLVPDVWCTADGGARLPNLTSFAVPDIAADVMLARLDLDGAAVSSGSACAAGAVEPSHVLVALDLPAWVRGSTVRVSLGRSNDEQEVRRLAGMVANIATSRGETALSGHRPERF